MPGGANAYRAYGVRDGAVGRVSVSATRRFSGQRQIRKYRSKRFARLTLNSLKREGERGCFHSPQHFCRCRYHP